MNNLETILKIREIRNNLPNLDLSLETKELLRKSLNFYENELDIEIARSNNNIDEFTKEGIEHDEKIIIPLEENSNKYQEYTNIKDIDLLDNIKYLINNIDKLNNNKIILNALKEYCLYLEQLNIKKINSEKFLEDLKNPFSK